MEFISKNLCVRACVRASVHVCLEGGQNPVISARVKKKVLLKTRMLLYLTFTNPLMYIN